MQLHVQLKWLQLLSEMHACKANLHGRLVVCASVCVSGVNVYEYRYEVLAKFRLFFKNWFFESFLVEKRQICDGVYDWYLVKFCQKFEFLLNLGGEFLWFLQNLAKYPHFWHCKVNLLVWECIRRSKIVRGMHTAKCILYEHWWMI